MVRYNLFPLIAAGILIAFMALGSNSARADDTFSGPTLYGFPMGIVPPDAAAAAIPGQGYSYNNIGYTLPDFGTTYGFEAHEESPLLGGSAGYFGPDLSGLDLGGLGISFGLTQADHDASRTAFSKNLFYQADLDNTFIGFPGIGVGSLGVNYPTISNQKSSVKYMESVSFEFSTESNKFQVGGFGYPLGLGLGYTSAMVNTGPTFGNLLNSSFYFG
jgi:hypothetical protein